MLAKADGSKKLCWALRDPETKILSLAHISKTEADAQRLRRGHMLHKNHDGALEVVPVEITITEVQR